jgi:hypothetical protein
MFVLPSDLTLCKVLGLRWCWGRIGNLGDEVCSRRLSNSINQDTDQGYLEKDEKAKGKAK